MGKVNREKVLEYLSKNTMAVMSSISVHGAMPQSAAVAYTETPDLEIIFGTFNDARKYANIKENPNVSFVIGWDEDEKITVQYEGIAHEVTGEAYKKAAKLHWTKDSQRDKYLSDPNERLFVVKPRFIRYCDYSTKPNNIFELTF